MPTMRSVGATADLRDRLANLGGGRVTEDDGRTEEAAGEEGGRKRRHIRRSDDRHDHHPPVRTPQELLSRDPEQLARGLGEPIERALNLRAAVAEAMAMGPSVDTPGGAGGLYHGGEACGIVLSVSRAVDEARRLLRGSDGGDDGEDTHCAFHSRRPPPVIVGSFTALDMCVHATLPAGDGGEAADEDDGGGRRTACGISSSHGPLVTGSARLDDLLSPPPEMAPGGRACRVLRSTVLPPRSRRLSDRKRRRRRLRTVDDDGFFGTDQGRTKEGEFGGRGGVYPGIVTEVAGPPSSGKTQISLSVSADAALRGWSVHYLAGGGGSASVLPLARRLRQMVSARTRTASSSSSHPRPSGGGGGIPIDATARALERVRFTTVPDGHRVLAALCGIEADFLLSSANDGGDGEGRGGRGAVESHDLLVVLDSASGCLAPDLYADGDGGIGASLVNEAALMLRRLSRAAAISPTGEVTGRCAVFVTNGTVSSHSSSSSSSYSGGWKKGGDGSVSGSIREGASSGGRPNHKLAMGSFWRAADVRALLESAPDLGEAGDGRAGGGLERSQHGLVVAPLRTVYATLDKHYAKPCGKLAGRSDDAVIFGISAAAIVDVST